MFNLNFESLHLMRYVLLYSFLLCLGVGVLFEVRRTRLNAEPCQRFGLSRPTYLLVFGLILASVLPLLTAPVCGGRCATQSLGVTFDAIFRSHTASSDSWTPIGNALRYLASNSAEGLYQTTYWHTDRQFIYSPLSVVFCRLTNWPPVLDWSSTLSLNQFFWWFLGANVILIVMIFNKFYQSVGVDAKSIGRNEQIALVCIPLVTIFLYFPLVNGYTRGNIHTWLTFLIILSLLLWLRGYRYGVGVCLGLVCIFKPTYAPILLWALLRREYSVIFGFLVILIPFGVASLIMFGFGVHWEYLDLTAYLSRRGEYSFGSSSVNSLLNRAIFNGPNLE